MEGGFQTDEERSLGFCRKGGFWIELSRWLVTNLVDSGCLLAIAWVGSNTRTSLYSVADTLYNDVSFAPQRIMHCAKLVSLEGTSALYCYHLTTQIK